MPAPNKKLRIGIVGAGIGGLTAAIALQQRGLSVVVHEQAAVLGEVGAGITVGPNANRVLAALGLEAELAALADPSPHVGTLDHKTGERLAYSLRGRDEYLKLYGAVSRLMHRADLHAVLERAFNPAGSALQLGQQLKSVQQDDDGVTLQFANGTTDRCDVLVACDGLKSIVRDLALELS